MNGQLKSLKDPYGQQINYDFDKVGRLNSVTGSTSFNGITNYASTPTYNARGILTHLNYGNGVEMNITNFNNKLQATNFELKKGSNIIQKKNYQFYEDGALKYSQDVKDAKFDRLYKYDFQGRTTIAKSGAEARGQTDAYGNIPYNQSYGYNAFDNMTNSVMRHYSSNTDYQTHTYINNRKTFTYQNLSVVYDAEGNEISDENNVYEFDTSGELVKTTPREEEGSNTLLQPTVRHIDGTGKELKRSKYWQNTVTSVITENKEYFIYSSATGKLVSEVNETGQKVKTFVSANGTTLAEQNKEIANTDRIIFNHQDASGASFQQTKADGTTLYNGRISEFDAVGNNVGDSDPYLVLITPPLDNDSSTNFTNSAYGFDNQGNPHLRQKYFRDGIEVPESNFRRMIDIGAIGGQFGILEMTARMSTKIEGWKKITPTKNPPNFKTKGGNSGDTSWQPTEPGNFGYADFVVEGGSTVRNWYTPVYNQSWSANLRLISFSNLFEGKNVSLSDDLSKKVDSAVTSIKNLKPSEDCQKNVIDKLAKLGFNLDDFKKYLEKGYKAYDITNSTISVVGSLFTEEQAKTRKLTSANTISETYKNKENKDASGKVISYTITTAVTSIQSDTFLTYLNPLWFGDENRNSAWIFHEALHGFLTDAKGRTDADIQNALGLSETDSVNITNYIRDNCFKGEKK
jgi:hypothetical protein